MRDDEALEEARSPSGSNRAAVNNQHESLREVVSMIRISGVARKNVDSSSKKSKKVDASKSKSKSESSAAPKKKEAPSFEELSAMKTGYEKEVTAADNIDASGLQDELDALDFGDDSESDLDDDEFDLR